MLLPVTTPAQKIAVTPATITTIAGTGTSGFTNGTATSSNIYPEQGIAVDGSGNIFFSENSGSSSNVSPIREISGGNLSLYSGGTSVCSAVYLACGDGSPVLNAEYGESSSTKNGVFDLYFDSNYNLYIGDAYDGRLRFVYKAGAGGGASPTALDNLLYALGIETTKGTAPTVGYIYTVVGCGNGHTSACTSYSGTTAAGTIANNLTFASGSLRDAAVDTAGDFYVSDYSDNRIFMVYSGGASGTAGYTLLSELGYSSPFTVGGLYNIAGNGTGADRASSGTGSAILTSGEISGPYGITLDASNNLYVETYAGGHILKVTNSSGALTILGGAGSGTPGYTGDGSLFSTSTEFAASPRGLTADAGGNLYFVDTSNDAIRKIESDGSGNIYTIAGLSGVASPCASSTTACGNLGDADYGNTGGTPGTNLAPGSVSDLNGPYAVALDASGNFYIADSGDKMIREVTVSGTTAGSSGAIVFPATNYLVTSSSIPVIISNVGSAQLNLSGFSYSGTNSTDFAVTTGATNPCTSTTQLASGTSCNLYIAFTPQDGTGSGLKSGNVTISSNGNSVIIALSGTSVAVTPTVSWGTISAITYGTALSGTQLNATATNPNTGTTVPGTFTYTPAAGIVLGSGSGQTLSVNFVPTDTNDYNTPSPTNNSITVNKAALTVTAGSPSITYGQTVPAYTATYSGFQNGDTQSVLSGSPSLTTSPATPVNAGTYTITAAIGTLSATNYTFATFNNGTLTINKAALTVTAGSPGITYGQIVPAYTATYTGFQNGDTQSVLSGSPSLTTSPATPVNAGTYIITAAKGSLSATNYNLAASTYVNGTLTINQAPLTVTAVSPSITYGQTVPVYTASYSGFQNGDTQSVISGSPSLTTSPATPVNAGTYTITAAKGTLSATNYNFNTSTYVNGTLTINSAGTNTTLAVFPTSTTAGTVSQANSSAPIYLTATVSSPVGAAVNAGTVTFSDSLSGTLGSATVNSSGVATMNYNQYANSTQSPVLHTVTAAYSDTANTNFTSSSSTPAINVTVNPLPPTTGGVTWGAYGSLARQQGPSYVIWGGNIAPPLPATISGRVGVVVASPLYLQDPLNYSVLGGTGVSALEEGQYVVGSNTSTGFTDTYLNNTPNASNPSAVGGLGSKAIKVWFDDTMFGSLSTPFPNGGIENTYTSGVASTARSHVSYPMVSKVTTKYLGAVGFNGAPVYQGNWTIAGSTGTSLNGGSNPGNLVQIAESAPMYELFNNPDFVTYDLEAAEFGKDNEGNACGSPFYGPPTYNSTSNSYTAAPTSPAWSQTNQACVYNEFYELTSYLLTTYNNSGKTFILQEWDGDELLNYQNAWGPVNSFAENSLGYETCQESAGFNSISYNSVFCQDIQNAIQWYNLRWAGVNDARAAFIANNSSAKNVAVLMAAEGTSIDTYGDSGMIGSNFEAPFFMDLVLPYLHMDMYGAEIYYESTNGNNIANSAHTSPVNVVYPAGGPDDDMNFYGNPDYYSYPIGGAAPNNKFEGAPYAPMPDTSTVPRAQQMYNEVALYTQSPSNLSLATGPQWAGINSQNTTTALPRISQPQQNAFAAPGVPITGAYPDVSAIPTGTPGSYTLCQCSFDGDVYTQGGNNGVHSFYLTEFGAEETDYYSNDGWGTNKFNNPMLATGTAIQAPLTLNVASDQVARQSLGQELQNALAAGVRYMFFWELYSNVTPSSVKQSSTLGNNSITAFWLLRPQCNKSDNAAYPATTGTNVSIWCSTDNADHGPNHTGYSFVTQNWNYLQNIMGKKADDMTNLYEAENFFAGVTGTGATETDEQIAAASGDYAAYLADSSNGGTMSFLAFIPSSGQYNTAVNYFVGSAVNITGTTLNNFGKYKILLNGTQIAPSSAWNDTGKDGYIDASQGSAGSTTTGSLVTSSGAQPSYNAGENTFQIVVVGAGASGGGYNELIDNFDVQIDPNGK
jgi:hypothetical protein